MTFHIPFDKYEGAGNDFVILRGEAVSHLPRGAQGHLLPELVRRLCDRRLGVGADGLMELLPQGEERMRVEMRYYNADGSSAAMCGNGARCALLYALRTGMVDDLATLQTPAGSVSGCALDPEAVWILLPDVGAPRFDPETSGWLIDTGVPHLVVETPRLDAPDLMASARRARWRVQPGGANVDYYTVRDGQVYCRTYERGVEAETPACGTGAVAVALIAAKRHRELSSPVVVHQPGGTLRVRFETELAPYGWRVVRLFGPARAVYSGTIAMDWSDLITKKD